MLQVILPKAFVIRSIGVVKGSITISLAAYVSACDAKVSNQYGGNERGFKKIQSIINQANFYRLIF